jgi:nucleotide-binding universal stress UspA family protein
MIYSKILVAYDSSPQSEEALKHAILLCEYFPSATLLVVHAFNYPNFVVGEAVLSPSAEANNEIYQQANAIMENAKSMIHPLPNATVELIQGNAAEIIVTLAKERFYDLIILGSRGLGGVRELLLGSVSHYVVQHAQIPVLVIK